MVLATLLSFIQANFLQAFFVTEIINQCGAPAQITFHYSTRNKAFLNLPINQTVGNLKLLFPSLVLPEAIWIKEKECGFKELNEQLPSYLKIAIGEKTVYAVEGIKKTKFHEFNIGTFVSFSIPISQPQQNLFDMNTSPQQNFKKKEKRITMLLKPTLGFFEIMRHYFSQYKLTILNQRPYLKLDLIKQIPD